MRYFILFVLLTGFMANTSFALDTDRLLRKAQRYFEPLPESMPDSENDTEEKIALGKKLFFEPRLSINDTQSCSSCHQLGSGQAGMDSLPTSPGAKGQFGSRNSPTVLNAGFQASQFWDARAEDLVEQAKGPILNPIEMGMPNEQAVVKKITAINEYQVAFNKVFPQSKVNYQNIAEAIAAFERTLITPSRFDDFLNGDTNALSMSELRGLETFIKVNCVSCHDGSMLGGVALEVMGKENPYSNQSDQGLFDISNKPEDRMVFKVAPLRNVALTAPYFHDGKIASLDEAVRMMGHLQLNDKLDEKEVKDIVSFLKALSGKQFEIQNKN